MRESYEKERVMRERESYRRGKRRVRNGGGERTYLYRHAPSMSLVLSLSNPPVQRGLAGRTLSFYLYIYIV
jgi:hypothetical protein